MRTDLQTEPQTNRSTTFYLSYFLFLQSFIEEWGEVFNLKDESKADGAE